MSQAKYIDDISISDTSNLYQAFPEGTRVDKEDVRNVIPGNNAGAEAVILFGETEEPLLAAVIYRMGNENYDDNAGEGRGRR